MIYKYDYSFKIILTEFFFLSELWDTLSTFELYTDAVASEGVRSDIWKALGFMALFL